MLTTEQCQAIRMILERLRSTDVMWSLTGSAGLVLQGMTGDVGDIDIQSDKSGIYRIEKAFPEYVVRPVTFSETHRIRSHFGELWIHGASVELMGAIQKRSLGGQWNPVPDLAAHLREVVWDGFRVPVLSLEYEAAQYDLLGRHATATRIREFLKRR